MEDAVTKSQGYSAIYSVPVKSYDPKTGKVVLELQISRNLIPGSHPGDAMIILPAPKSHSTG